ncbi:MAG: glucosamine-6-phosphate deaminase [Pseudomonadota bacterium]
MRVLILPDTRAAAARAAAILAERLAALPTLTLGFATGETMRPFYAELIARHRAGLSFAQATSFNLDEYVGVAQDHPGSFAAFMQDVLFSQIDLSPTRAHLPRGDAADPEAEALRYEAALSRKGGIDLQVLGIGQNGHLAFNEPTSSLASRTRVKTLAPSTRAANRPAFLPGEAPSQAITMGLGTILDARECLLLATGSRKADAVAAAIEGPLGAHCPASILQLHRRVSVVLDEDAASALSLHQYYETVHPGGGDARIG